MSQDEHDSHSQELRQHVHEDLDELLPPPSNRKLLCIAFVSFQSFATIQIFVALYAGSEAMLGDSVAMMVDALTYLFNLIAERQKEVYASKLQQQNNFSSDVTDLTRTRMVLQYRKYTYQLELLPPLISVSILMVVTVLVLRESIHTLILDSQRDASLQSDPNIDLMVIFSFFNLLLDVLNVGCFASASHALGYKTDRGDRDKSSKTRVHGETCHTFEDDDVEIDDDYDSDGIEMSSPVEKDSVDTDSVSTQSHDYDDRFNDGDNDDSTNLNMCSAYTHVFADTLRSFAVILASLLAKFTDRVTPEVADSTAAIIVSILIFLSLFPLIGGMVQTFKSLRDIDRLLKRKKTTRGEHDEEEEDNVELLRFANEP